MSLNNLVLGAHFGPAVLLANDGNRDAGASYAASLLTNPEAPAGEGGVCIFTMVHLTVTHDIPVGQSVAVRVTPYVDDTRVTESSREIIIQGEGRRVSVNEPLPLRYAYGQAEYGKVIGLFSPRGNRIALKVETGELPEGVVILDGWEMRYTVVGEERGSALISE